MNKAEYFMQLKEVRDGVPADAQSQFDMLFAGKEKSTTVALVLGLFLGGLGIDRFYIGNILLGILKFLTLGLFGIWTIVDWFLIMGAARKVNIEIANEVRLMISGAPTGGTAVAS